MANKHREYSDRIDWRLFGLLLRNARSKAGYTRAEDFSDAIRERTGADMTKAVIYRIESGTQEPSSSQLFLMASTLGLGADEILEYFRICTPMEWRSAHA